MRESWLFIIIQIVLCALCPFLLIPFWIICSFAERHENITAQNVVSVIFLIAIGFIAIVAPVITIVTIIQDGFVSALNSFGMGFAIIIFEIHTSLYYLWRTKISKKLGKAKNASHKSICNSHQTAFIVGALCFVALLLKLWTDDNEETFFPTLISLYGFTFVFWDLAAEK